MPVKFHRKGRKQAKRVGEVLPAVLRGMGLDRRMEEAGLLGAWGEIVGEAVARRSRPREIRGGKLVVEVADNAWMQEIRFHRREILARIRERFPAVEIRDMLLRIERERNGE